MTVIMWNRGINLNQKYQGFHFQMFSGRLRQIVLCEARCGVTTRRLSQEPVMMTRSVLEYCDQHSSPLPSVLSGLQADCAGRFSNSHMMTGPHVLRLNMLLCRAIGANKVLDIGVFTGSSSLAAALATDHQSKIFALEKSKKYIDFARQYWSQAGVENKIELMIGNAGDSLNQLIDSGHAGTFDFIYIDADKSKYPEYFQQSVQLSRRGGILAVDNTLFRGEVLEQQTDKKTVLAIQTFNSFARDCPEVTLILLPVSDGLSLAIKN